MKIILPVFVLVVSIIYGLPNLILASKLKAGYTPFTLKGSPIARDEAFAYGPETLFVYKNKSLLKEIYAKEYQDFPTPFKGESAPAALLALLTVFTGSLQGSFIAADFIFPPIIFLAFYYIAHMFVKNKLLALSCAFAAVVARDLVAVIPFPGETLKYLTVQENQNYLLYLSRAFHPQVSFVFFLAPIILTFKVIENPKNYKYTFTLGLFIGLIFYSYVFYWTLFVFFYLLTIIFFLIKKHFYEIRMLIIPGVLGLAIGSYYILNIFQFYKLPFVEDFVTKSSLHNVPLPMTLMRYLLISILFLTCIKRKDSKSFVFFIFLLAGVLITPISKIFIGQDLETFHYLRRAMMPFYLITIFICLYSLSHKHKLVLKITSLTMIIVIFLFGLRTQWVAVDVIQNNHIKDQSLESLMGWFNENSENRAVIGTLNPDIASLIPLYTSNLVYIPPTDRTIMPTYEGIERYKILSELLGVSKEMQEKKIKEEASFFFVYQAYNDDGYLDPESERVKRAVKQIKELSYKNNWESKVQNYELDYIVVTLDEISIIKPYLNYIEPVLSINNYLVFRFK